MVRRSQTRTTAMDVPYIMPAQCQRVTRVQNLPRCSFLVRTANRVASEGVNLFPR